MCGGEGVKFVVAVWWDQSEHNGFWIKVEASWDSPALLSASPRQKKATPAAAAAVWCRPALLKFFGSRTIRFIDQTNAVQWSRDQQPRSRWRNLRRSIILIPGRGSTITCPDDDDGQEEEPWDEAHGPRDVARGGATPLSGRRGYAISYGADDHY